MKKYYLKVVVLFLFMHLLSVGIIHSQNNNKKSRRSQRVVPMNEVQVVSPDSNVKFILSPNAERLTFTVKMGETTVIENSPIIMKLDWFDLSSGVVFKKLERYKIDESYPWYGAKSTAANKCDGAKIYFENDLSNIDFILEVRAFNDGIAFRQIIPEDDSASHEPDEYTTFVIPKNSEVWYVGLDGHYEGEYKSKNISDIQVRRMGWAANDI